MNQRMVELGTPLEIKHTNPEETEAKERNSHSYYNNYLPQLPLRKSFLSIPGAALSPSQSGSHLLLLVTL